jgi:hypothetical protein
VFNNVLYIIGNGFDIYHGINSRYSDFKKYLLEVDESLYDLITEYIPVDENWSDLEEALADTERERIVEYALDFFEPYGADDWSEEYNHNYQNAIEEIVNGLSVNLKSYFVNWVTQLYIPKRAEVEIPTISLDRNAKFLSFNYTSTLSTIYEVPRSHILFIHGEAGNSNKEITLGHAWKPDASQEENYPDPDADPRLTDGEDLVVEFFNKTFKNVQRIIDENKSFFVNLHEVANIYILGHSLSSVDVDYLNEIIRYLNVDRVLWKISYFGDDELDRHRTRMTELGIHGDNMMFCKLEDF